MVVREGGGMEGGVRREMSVCFTYRCIIVNSEYLLGKCFPGVLLNYACVNGAQDFMDPLRFMQRRRRGGKYARQKVSSEMIGALPRRGKLAGKFKGYFRERQEWFDVKLRSESDIGRFQNEK